MRKKYIIILFCISFLCSSGKGLQNYNSFGNYTNLNLLSIKDKKNHPDLSGWVLGGQAGYYLSGKATANYYKGEGENSIQYLLYYDWIKQKIKEQVGGYDYSNIVLPENMTYQPAFWIGFFAKLANENGSGAFIEFNFSKLHAADKFTIEVEKFNGGLKQPYVQECDIMGTEERINVNLGYSFCMNEYPYKPYLQFGLNINDTKVKEHKILIGTYEASIMNPVNTYYNIPQGGVGFGGFAGIGVQLFLGKVSVDPGLDMYYKKVNLGNTSEFDFHYTFYVRLSTRL